jgi:type III pantothenate kinase
MILAFDIDTHETVIGLFADGELADHWTISTRTQRSVDELGLLVRTLMRESGFDADEVRAAVIASAAPRMTDAAAETAEVHLGARVLVVDAAADLPVRIELDDAGAVSGHRIANTIAAARLFRRDTILVDMGTTTSFDCISAAGVLVGGVLAPGMRDAAEAAAATVARPPRIDFAPAASVIGRSSADALRAGIHAAAADAVEGIIRRIRDEWRRPSTHVVATGPLAGAVAPHCPSISVVDPFLTLTGLHLAFRHAEGARSRRR